MVRFSIAGALASLAVAVIACGSSQESSPPTPTSGVDSPDASSGPTNGGTVEQPATPGTPGAIAIAAGGGHTCALAPSGTVKCWGMNIVGQAANASTAVDYEIETPSEVSSLTGQAAAFTAGEGWSCALTRSHGVKCWGSHGDGQLGYFLEAASFTNVPSDVPALTSGVRAISGSDRHSCALLDSGGVVCWGANPSGQLGRSTPKSSATPLEVAGLGPAIAVAAGGDHSCALLADGKVMCWGSNKAGQLGDGSKNDSPIPVAVGGLGSGVKRLSAGRFHTCVVTGTGGIKCWGANAGGQLGDGTTTQRASPVDVQGLTGAVRAVVLGYQHGCALTEAGGAECWGYNDKGQVGSGASGDPVTSKAVPVVGLGAGVIGLAVGYEHACAMLDGGKMQCWGRNEHGELGDGTMNDSGVPKAVIDFP